MQVQGLRGSVRTVIALPCAGGTSSASGRNEKSGVLVAATVGELDDVFVPACKSIRRRDGAGTAA